MKENNVLLNSFLNVRYFNEGTIIEDIEFIIRPECNQKCKYCYITQYGDDLYPKEERVSTAETLKNIDMLLEYLLFNRKVYLKTIDLFAGDLFYDDIFFDILDIFYKYFNRLQKENPSYFYTIPKTHLMIPCNLSFVKSDEKVKRFDEYEEKMREVGIFIILSYSTDGIYAIDSREQQSLDQEWFDKTLSFCARHHYGTHPMISPENVEFAIQNYDWWIENLNKYHKGSTPLWHPMFLEVRNEGWTSEKIDQYLQFLNHVFEYRLELFENDIYNLAKHLTQHESETNIILTSPPNDPIKFYVHSDFQNAINCSLGRSFMINVANLNIVPCHRLTYPHLAAGNFIVENDVIIGVAAKEGASGYINLVDGNRFYRPSCTICEINKFCLKGCFGSQYEQFGDPYITIPSICRLAKAKMNFLIDKYYETGLLEIILNPEFENYNLVLAKEIYSYLTYRKESQR